MHIGPGIVDGAKLVLGYATAVTAAIYSVRQCYQQIVESGVLPSLGRGIMTTVLVLFFFQVLPHPPIGVSEVHFIFGSMLFLLFGTGAAAFGLAVGLLVQGMVFAPFDLPQYGMNLTTLLVPLFGLKMVANRIIGESKPYVDLAYSEVLKLSATYQAGIVAWVAFWAFYGQGAAAWSSVVSFGVAYMGVVLFEPIVDLAVLRIAKGLHAGQGASRFARLFESRLTAA